MLYTEVAVRDNIRNRQGHRVFYLGEGDCLTSEAKAYLQRERIAILPADQARPSRYRLASGGYVKEKPEHMTHLNAQVLVEKSHPRILFRGAMDTLESALLLCGSQYPALAVPLQEFLDLAREIVACDVLDKPLKEKSLLGLTPEQLRSHSHRPQDYYQQPHFMPQMGDSGCLLALNDLRCVVRQTELRAVAAYLTPGGRLVRTDIIKALNRMSSGVYLLMIQEKKNGK